jgi:nucleotide-binding universal stress UspA family protein
MNNFGLACVEIDSAWSDQQKKTEVSGSSARKILVPISQSQRSHEALTLALLLARESGRQLVLLHAVQLNIVGEERGIGRGRLLQELMSAAESRLKALASSMCEDVPFSVIVSEGPPDIVILWMARALSVDAIVMGPRLQGGLSWMRRNTVRAVLRQTPCPIYIVKPMGGLATASMTNVHAAGPNPRKAGEINRSATPQIAIQQSTQ